MNKKAILIENRPQRSILYMPNREKDYDKLELINSLRLCIPKGQHQEFFVEIIGRIDNGEFNKLEDYDLIMAHRSLLSELANGPEVNSLINFSKDRNKDLILFSGGISGSIYSKDKGRFLLINSRDFYSNLIPFIQNYCNGKTVELLELKYGVNWELAYLLRLRELMKLQDIGEPIPTEEFDEMMDVLNVGVNNNIDERIKEIINKI
jgi:hypothetical protein